MGGPSGTFQQILGVFKAVVEIRLCTLGNLGVKAEEEEEEEDWQPPGRTWSGFLPGLPLFLGVAGARVSAGRPANPWRPALSQVTLKNTHKKKKHKNAKASYSDDVRLESESELEFQGLQRKHGSELWWDRPDCCSVFP